MKKSELRLLVSDYRETKVKFIKSNNEKLKRKMEEIEQKYFHETGESINAYLKGTT